MARRSPHAAISNELNSIDNEGSADDHAGTAIRKPLRIKSPYRFGKSNRGRKPKLPRRRVVSTTKGRKAIPAIDDLEALRLMHQLIGFTGGRMRTRRAARQVAKWLQNASPHPEHNRYLDIQLKSAQERLFKWYELYRPYSSEEKRQDPAAYIQRRSHAVSAVKRFSLASEERFWTDECFRAYISGEPQALRAWENAYRQRRALRKQLIAS